MNKESVLEKISPTSTYIGTAVKNFINQVTEVEPPSFFKKGDVIKIKASGNDKNRPSVIIKVFPEYVISIPLTTTESIHVLCESKTRFFRDGYFSNSYVVTTNQIAKENFIGVYDNPKLLNKAISELRLFIVKNI